MARSPRTGGECALLEKCLQYPWHTANLALSKGLRSFSFFTSQGWLWSPSFNSHLSLQISVSVLLPLGEDETPLGSWAQFLVGHILSGSVDTTSTHQTVLPPLLEHFPIPTMLLTDVSLVSHLLSSLSSTGFSISTVSLQSFLRCLRETSLSYNFCPCLYIDQQCYLFVCLFLYMCSRL